VGEQGDQAQDEILRFRAASERASLSGTWLSILHFEKLVEAPTDVDAAEDQDVRTIK